MSRKTTTTVCTTLLRPHHFGCSCCSSCSSFFDCTCFDRFYSYSDYSCDVFRVASAGPTDLRRTRTGWRTGMLDVSATGRLLVRRGRPRRWCGGRLALARTSTTGDAVPRLEGVVRVRARHVGDRRHAPQGTTRPLGAAPTDVPGAALFRGPFTGFFENDLFPPAVRVYKKKHIFNLEVPAAAAAVAAAERQQLGVVGGRGAVHQERCCLIEVASTTSSWSCR